MAAANNLRVIYQNLADLSTTTITCDTTANSSKAIFTGTITNNSTTLTINTLSSGTVAIGMYISGGTIPSNTYIISGSGTSWTLNQSISPAQTAVAITATATTTPTANLQKDAKSLIWRSSGNSATLTIAFGSSKTIRGVILPFTNLSAIAVITVTPTGGTGTTTLTGVLACPYAQTDNWDSTYLPSGASSYAYGSGTYARAWFSTPQTCTGLTITITDTSLTYIEASRLVIGDYWSPTYNTSFGLVSAPKSLSSNSRTESGDLVTNRGIQYNSMSFDLAWLNPADRKIFTKILKSNGINKPLFISLFPDASEDFDKEQTYQIYGKLVSLSDITHPMYTMYTAKVDIEEI